MKLVPSATRAARAAVLCLFVTFACSSPTIAAPCGVGSSLFESAIHYTTGINPGFLAVGDFNEDGIRDLAVANSDFIAGGANGSLAILIGTGPRTFASPVLYDIGDDPHGVVVGDFNEDDIQDVAVANLDNDNVSVLLGLGTGGVGNGTFGATVNYPVGNAPFQLITADFDEDGILDLATALNESPGLSVLRGLGSAGVGDGTFGPPITFALSSVSSALKSGDFDRDGNLDIVVTEYYPGTVAIFLGTGASSLGPGSFAPPVHWGVGPQPFNVLVADFNEDGNPDLAVANTAMGGTSILLGPGNGSFPSRTTLASGNNGGLAAADFDQDGILDLAIGHDVNDGSGSTRVYLGNGSGGVGNGTFGNSQSYFTGSDPYQYVPGDFDGDGFQDLLIANNRRDFISLMPGTCVAPPPDPRYPVLTDVRDVPNDEGGRVFLTWTASSLDAPGGPVIQYRVWRRIPAGAAAPRAGIDRERWMTRTMTAPDGSTDIVYWEALVTLPAQRLAGYGYTAATTQDSMRHSNPYSAFFVSALTSNIDIFYSSNVDSGYSVDNNRPGPPHAFIGELVSSGVMLQWDENPEPDVTAYRLYRGTTEDFVPSDENRIASPEEASFLDEGAPGAHYYKLSAVDEHENESDFAVLTPLAPTAVGESAIAFALSGAHPNPSRGEPWTLSLSLPSAGPASMEILDLSGRRVGYRDLNGLGGGRHQVVLRDPARLPSGVYVIRLAHGHGTRDIKAVVVR
jgi:hypothetical protein